jgi:flagellar biosynthesis anti-sigma factor FlgM
MRIEPKVATPVHSESREPSKAASADKGTPASVVHLSAAGTSATRSHDPQPATTQRLAKIRESIQRGSYPVDLDKLAARIVEDEFTRGVGE